MTDETRDRLCALAERWEGRAIDNRDNPPLGSGTTAHMYEKCASELREVLDAEEQDDHDTYNPVPTAEEAQRAMDNASRERLLHIVEQAMDEGERQAGGVTDPIRPSVFVEWIEEVLLDAEGEKPRTMTCNRGHESPAGLWNCPVCTDPILDAEGEREPVASRDNEILGEHLVDLGKWLRGEVTLREDLVRDKVRTLFQALYRSSEPAGEGQEDACLCHTVPSGKQHRDCPVDGHGRERPTEAEEVRRSRTVRELEAAIERRKDEISPQLLAQETISDIREILLRESVGDPLEDARQRLREIEKLLGISAELGPPEHRSPEPAEEEDVPTHEQVYAALRDTITDDTRLSLHFEELEIIAEGVARRLRGEGGGDG